jgi:hypothetical protein
MAWITLVKFGGNKCQLGPGRRTLFPLLKRGDPANLPHPKSAMSFYNETITLLRAKKTNLQRIETLSAFHRNCFRFVFSPHVESC